MKVFVVTKVEFFEGADPNTIITSRVCGSNKKAQQLVVEMKGEVMNEYVFKDDVDNVDYVVKDDGLNWSISFPHEETKIEIKIEQQDIIEDEEETYKQELEATWKTLDVQQECVLNCLIEDYEGCSRQDAKLLEALTICKDYIRDMKEDY